MEIIAKLLGSYLIAPATWITLLLIAGLIIKQKNLKKRLLLSSAILYLFFTNQLISSYIIGNFQPKAVTLKDSANYFTSESIQFARRSANKKVLAESFNNQAIIFQYFGNRGPSNMGVDKASSNKNCKKKKIFIPMIHRKKLFVGM